MLKTKYTLRRIGKIAIPGVLLIEVHIWVSEPALQR